MSNTFKIIANVNAGLNDIFGNLVRTYFMFEHKKDSVISFYSPQYSSDNLSKYFNFNNKIKVIQQEEYLHSKYNHKTSCSDGSLMLNYTTEQINKVFSIKPEFVNLFKEYNDRICIHFRHMGTENSVSLAEWEFKNYKETFLKIYQPDKRYLIISDSAKWSSEFLDKDNIELLIPTTDINPPGCRNDSSRLRNGQLELSIHQICAAAHCNKIYRTCGNFLNLTRSINDSIEFINFINTNRVQTQATIP